MKASTKSATPMSSAEIFKRVGGVLQQSLGVQPDEATLNDRLIHDLGAESIDLLDVAFRMEKAFDIKIPRGELFPTDQNGNMGTVLTEEILDYIKRNLRPGMEIPPIQLGETRIWDLFTVRFVCQYLAAVLKVRWEEPAGA